MINNVHVRGLKGLFYTTSCKIIFFEKNRHLKLVFYKQLFFVWSNLHCSSRYIIKSVFCKCMKYISSRKRHSSFSENLLAQHIQFPNMEGKNSTLFQIFGKYLSVNNLIWIEYIKNIMNITAQQVSQKEPEILADT